jgi:excinuclease ABC subunit C
VQPDFHFEQRIAFTPERAQEILRIVPSAPGVFALRSERAADEPYLTRAADVRRRLTRLLAPPDSQSKRLNLRERVSTIEFTVTGSEFESLLVLYDAAAASFGYAEARRRLRLHTPFLLRLTMDHEHPRLYTTNRLTRKGLAQTYGPFPSRNAAERYLDGVLDLFQLRRCHEDLEVHASHPGCAYGEMKRCMAPCNLGCTAEEYKQEAARVEAFLQTHGESMLQTIGSEREQASAQMDFERAAALHERFSKVKAIAALADDLVQPIEQVRGVIVQASAPREGESDAQEAAIFLLEAGCVYGPEWLSTLGVRAAKEQTSVGSSLFAQPLMLQAVPLDEGPSTPVESPEVRAEAVLARLEGRVRLGGDLAQVSDHLSLVRRWYYRPEKQRAGEFFAPNPDGSWPVRRILRGAARMALGEPRLMAETDRAGAAAAKTKILHEGRPDVQREVPVVAHPARRAKNTPAVKANKDEGKLAEHSVRAKEEIDGSG